MSDQATAAAQPLQPSFEQAIEVADLWCHAWEQGELSDEVLADRVAELVASRDGARGFFVVSLPADNPLMDRLPDPLLIVLRAAGAELVDLSVRNLAMSTAMVLEHGRSGATEQQQGSERVQGRCRELLRLLEPALVKARLEGLLAATRGEGADLAFLERWGYDDDQRQAIAAALLSVAQ
ncbi:MAG: hypothetical protein ACOYLI_00925 [Synechococcus lacustris]|jgi:hypothetical protein